MKARHRKKATGAKRKAAKSQGRRESATAALTRLEDELAMLQGRVDALEAQGPVVSGGR